MDCSTLLLIVVVIALIVWIIFGGTVKVSKEGIEVDTEGLLKYLREAEAQKHLPPQTSEPELRRVSAKIKGVTRKLPIGTILWVDDRPLNNQKEKMALARIGIFADSYATNAEALSALETGDYDIVISDIGRGDTRETGWDLLQAVHPKQPDLPFIFYTMNITDHDRNEAKNGGARGITERPDELIKLVAASIEHKRKAHA